MCTLSPSGNEIRSRCLSLHNFIPPPPVPHPGSPPSDIKVLEFLISIVHDFDMQPFRDANVAYVGKPLCEDNLSYTRLNFTK